MRKLLIVIYILLSSTLAAMQLSEQAKIQIITCTQGEQVWSKYGHTAIRVIDSANKMDYVFNYGIFNLMADDFYIKFVKGETYYQLGIEYYQHFVSFYGSIGRTIYWQELQLTQAQKQQIFDALLLNYQPENRYYLYNFVFDNCATRPYHLIMDALQDSIISDYQGYYGTDFRQAISHYTGKNSWVDFGINLVFGNKADQPMTNEERLFLPEELMNYLAQAKFADGTPLVVKQHIGAFPPNTTPWWANCWLGIAAFALIMTLLSIYDRRRKKLTWWIDLILIVIYILLTAIVIFLTYFSCHPLVGFNWRLILLPIIHLCARFVYFVRR